MKRHLHSNSELRGAALDFIVQPSVKRWRWVARAFERCSFNEELCKACPVKYECGNGVRDKVRRMYYREICGKAIKRSLATLVVACLELVSYIDTISSK